MISLLFNKFRNITFVCSIVIWKSLRLIVFNILLLSYLDKEICIIFWNPYRIWCLICSVWRNILPIRVTLQNKLWLSLLRFSSLTASYTSLQTLKALFENSHLIFLIFLRSWRTDYILILKTFFRGVTNVDLTLPIFYIILLIYTGFVVNLGHNLSWLRRNTCKRVHNCLIIILPISLFNTLVKQKRMILVGWVNFCDHVSTWLFGIILGKSFLNLLAMRWINFRLNLLLLLWWFNILRRLS